MDGFVRGSLKLASDFVATVHEIVDRRQQARKDKKTRSPKIGLA